MSIIDKIIAKDWKAPAPVEPPIIPPKKPDPIVPEPEKPVEEQPNDIDTRLTALEKLVKAITDWLDGLFKNWRK